MDVFNYELIEPKVENVYSLEEVYEELSAQKEELSAAIDFLQEQNKELEKRLEEVQKKNNEMDMLIYRMYHDLKSPISTSLGLINISKYVEYEEFLSKIKPHILKMERDLYNLIDFASSIQGNDNAQPSTPFQEFKKEIESIIENDIGSDNFIINWSDIDYTSLDATIRIMLKQLLLNALFFRSNERILEINVKLKKEIGECFFVIQDNGKGMNEETINRCTEMFYRGTEESKGSGLGLYIVKNIVEKAGGKLEIKSELNTGSTFLITLPC